MRLGFNLFFMDNEQALYPSFSGRRRGPRAGTDGRKRSRAARRRTGMCQPSDARHHGPVPCLSVGATLREGLGHCSHLHLYNARALRLCAGEQDGGGDILGLEHL